MNAIAVLNIESDLTTIKYNDNIVNKYTELNPGIKLKNNFF